MNLYIINHKFHYGIESLIRVFFPNENIKKFRKGEKDVNFLNYTKYKKPYIITEINDEKAEIIVKINLNNESLKINNKDNNNNKKIDLEEKSFNKEKTIRQKTKDNKENENIMKKMLYKLLYNYTGIKQPWGLQTGVRPVKYFRTLKDSTNKKEAINYFKDKLKVSSKKTNLTVRVEKIEKKIIDLLKKNSFSLYISIPFCPGRCNYCSFVSQSVKKSTHLIEPYTNLLCKEIIHVAKIVNKLNLNLETVYIGGGTPTTLNKNQLNKILSTINSNFNTENVKEFTVEAGRPDTITEEKLITLKNNNVDRISINPQTLNNNILNEIGRNHTAEDMIKAYNLAQNIGFKTINTDLIVGFLNDTFKSYKNTLDTICNLKPENITVHSLSIKRSADLTEENIIFNKKHGKLTDKMLDYSNKKLTKLKYKPYYLYRQSRTVGNFENTGWSQKSHESLYNVYVMDETHTIIGCGAGAVSKLKQEESNYLERIFNFKYPYEYVNRFNELLERKNYIKEFYDNYNK